MMFEVTTTKIVVPVVLAFMYFFSPDVKKTAQTQSDLKEFIETFTLRNEESLPKDYESTLYVLGKDILAFDKNTDTGNTTLVINNNLDVFHKELNKRKKNGLDGIFSLYDLYPGSYLFDQPTKYYSVDAVYIFTYHHKAIDPDCLNSDQKCNNDNELPRGSDLVSEPKDSQATTLAKRVRNQYENMFFYFDFLKENKSFHINAMDHKVYTTQYFSQDDNYKALISNAENLLPDEDSKLKEIPAAEHKAIYLLSGVNGDKRLIGVSIRLPTNYSAGQLSTFYRTIPGKKIKELISTKSP
ncbi:hypothetical protein [Endozoicomonas euniceicola]|uniref:Uncharacterized protein n=1 Tax=Endozoicomonas euniceicola TaxID=1234143 RepID=A0ABY6GQP3_9GAMM|nr:hypothetical protein [Endozoicomonas euniceicola]UYM15000.1 hypothetical protein NX720_19320 [Endozoicomonas euniceicola]